MQYILKTKCPKCEAGIAFRNGVLYGLNDITEEPDVPWVKVKWKRKRFDKCENGHNFNIRPYADYDDHYIYEDIIRKRIKGLKKELKDLEKINAEQI